ncbi:MAG: glycosyltransferase family 9 protein [Gemmatimonadota bacterium]
MSAADPQRILLIQLYHLGDVVLTTPAIRATRARFPKARIDFLAGPLGAQTLENNPHLDQVMVEPSLRELRRARYDAVADMHSVPRTALYTFATRARVRAGIRGRGPRNFAYTHLRERESEAVYMVRQKLRVLAPLGVDAERADLKLEIAMGEVERVRAKAILAELPRPIAALSPVAKHEFKQWGTERWAAVADALASNGVSILITSGPGEEEQARAVAERMQHKPLWQYGRTTVRELAALYESCALWLGNDGGPKHVAVAAGTPTVTIYRRKLGRVWSDENDSNQISLNSGSDGLNTIAVEDVVASASSRLREDR